MTTVTIAQVNAAIVSGSFSDEQLRSIGDAIRFAREQLVRKATCVFSTGSKVKFMNSKPGYNKMVIGTVVKVNRKFIIIKDNATMMNWRVPGNMLSAA